MPDERNTPVPLPQHAQPRRVPGAPADKASGPPTAKKVEADEFPFSVSVYISSQSGSMWQSRLPAKFPRSG